MYKVQSPPATLPEELVRYLLEEFSQISKEFTQSRSEIILQTLYAAPVKLIEGMIVKADGTSWNPGSGAGVYVRAGSSWLKL